VIDALYAASQAGTRIDLVVRGICCLRPGVPGLSETITVRSIVGRFLEHSRIYRFGGRPVVDGAGVTGPAGAEGGGDGAEAEGPASYWIGSGDLMDRNLDRRVEALVPVIDPELCERLETVLELNLTDDSSAWSLGPDGSWTRVATREGVSAQASLRALARERGRRRRSPDALAVDVAGVGGNRLGAAAPPA
jgi:polyphosphate kinase